MSHYGVFAAGFSGVFAGVATGFAGVGVVRGVAFGPGVAATFAAGVDFGVADGFGVGVTGTGQSRIPLG